MPINLVEKLRQKSQRVQGHAWLHGKFEDRLGCIRPCLKKPNLIAGSFLKYDLVSVLFVGFWTWFPEISCSCQREVPKRPKILGVSGTIHSVCLYLSREIPMFLGRVQ